MIDKFKCNIGKSLIEAWKIINENGKGIVFIVDNNDKLFGVMTDGDIRTYLLNQGKMDADIIDVVNKDFIYGSTKDTHQELINKFNERIKIIPIVNDDNKIVDFMEYSLSVYIPVAIPNLYGKELEYLTDAFLSTWISSSGSYINMFENNFSSYIGTKYGVAVSNGTVALHLALIALGVGEGDEVIVPDLTFAATINAVLYTNATPVIVDIELDSWCVNPNEIKKAITSRTKAIIPVHLYGQPCNMEKIMDIAKQNNLYVIEDCAEAHGASYNNKKVGSFGDISCFSFFGNKIITTGEGGMCVTNNDRLTEKMRVLRDHGMSKAKRYWHDYVGYNFRMTNLQASIGVAQLERIKDILFEREKIELKYREVLSDCSNVEFQKNELINAKKVIWLVSLLIKGNREEYLKVLNENGIDARPFFYSLSIMPPYRKFKFSNKNSLLISKKGINLPCNNQINEKILSKIQEIFRKFNN